MLVSAKNYWTKLLPMCIKKTCTIPKEFYYLLSFLKSLQAKIDEEVIKEFVSDADNIKWLIEEIEYTKGLYDKNYNTGKKEYYITSSYNTNEIEDIINEVFKVTYINDDYVRVERY